MQNKQMVTIHGRKKMLNYSDRILYYLEEIQSRTYLADITMMLIY